MPKVTVLDVRLYGQPVATLTNLQDGRTIFAFNEVYIEDERRPTLSLSYKDPFGAIVTKFRPYNMVVPPFFSNLLPEGPLRRYLADRAGVKPTREFFLLWMLGRDLPGAVTVHPSEGDEAPPDGELVGIEARPNALRFSLAGVQLKFSAFKNDGKGGGLTISAEGTGGSWIVKLPSQQFSGVPENEFAMMTVAGMMGMNVPEIQLVDLDAVSGLPQGIGELQGQALAIRRFDRTPDGPVHIEDFAQVFGVFPDHKYDKGNYRMIGRVLGIETGEADVAEFIRRLVFSTLIGNGDMHLKNWSLIYPDRRTPALAPAYDLLSTIPYIEGEDTAALNFSRTKKMTALSMDELAHLAAKAELPEKLVFDAARETVERFRAVWDSEKNNLPMAGNVRGMIDAHASSIELYRECT
ncbi:type II toxin-antitoxin system HipA family toxin [Rhizobium laguerreae]|uniref:type II toxin-antitoxin system HipA family toxin n=1 Tax=Rhizobium laguerreae TaxID=1076926 RepID=UPI001C8FEAC0|nr:type II toxin-antitoxin system HipA family toxin [Rhizobium laguerreae]MBY3246696.1 type II toxin-antitoxin system HipA family toxin [Rhizobium laguerreae]MBY3252288.1 type II toxin-antitoxin system HipA family toxin [Rhizobium laguerreae]MBY3307821.1 type II toxin-antitoxin system HipA family toxin [Rhizobium laguerreae]MBY3321931.1 type II toxin-antitoxin system HipA family toxin [Rhizobium laguerreae]MBY3328434.1 type II toxin-antitoxin system HipA family toxin [Rhizobium laguerreae]